MLATRLASIAPTTIHKSQAGFIPGRDIADQTKLIETIIDYAEAAEKKWADHCPRPGKSL